MTLGNLILKYRMENDMSQRQFAARCGVSNAYISMLEKGVNPSTGKPVVPTMQQFRAIYTAMGYTLDEILRLIDDEAFIPLKREIIRLAAMNTPDEDEQIVYHPVVSGHSATSDQGIKKTEYTPVTSEAKILAKGIDRMPEADRQKLLKMVDLMFSQYKEFFEGTDSDDT